MTSRGTRPGRTALLPIMKSLAPGAPAVSGRMNPMKSYMLTVKLPGSLATAAGTMIPASHSTKKVKSPKPRRSHGSASNSMRIAARTIRVGAVTTHRASVSSPISSGPVTMIAPSTQLAKVSANAIANNAVTSAPKRPSITAMREPGATSSTCHACRRVVLERRYRKPIGSSIVETMMPIDTPSVAEVITGRWRPMAIWMPEPSSRATMKRAATTAMISSSHRPQLRW